MNDNPSPLGIHPDDQLEARLTAWVLGEASPFEIAELESLVAKSPELQLFLNRTRALHALLQEAETTANEPDEEWKLHPGKRFKIARAFGENPEIPRLPLPEKESRIRRASFRAAWGIAAVFVVTFFSLRLLPRDYEAEAVIEIKPRERMINPLSGEMSPRRAMTPQFFGTEFNKIKSRNSLLKVVEDLDLTARWNTDKETALKRLKDSVETENIPGTDLIAIRVRQPDEQEAKEITRAVTEGYRDYRNSLEEKSQEVAVNELRKAVREQEDKVEDRRKILTTISRTKNIPYHGDRDMVGQGGVDEDRLPEITTRSDETEGKSLERSIDTTDYVDAKRDFETDLALLEQMKLKLISEEIAEELPRESIVIHDEPTITGRKFPSNPLDALKKAITPDTKSSEPHAVAEVSLPAAMESSPSADQSSELPGDKMDIAGNAPDNRPRVIPPAPAEPSAEMEKVIAAQAASKVQIPVPDLGILTQSSDFGDGDDFSGGFASRRAPASEGSEKGREYRSNSTIVDAGNRSGEKAIIRNSIDALIDNTEGSAAAGKPAAPAPPASELLADAQRLRQSGKLDEARETLTRATQAEGADVAKFKEEIAALDDPIRSNPALSQEGEAMYQQPRAGVDLTVPADAADGKEGKASAELDLYVESTAPEEIASLTGLFSDGIGSDFKQGADSNSRFNMDLRAGAESSANNLLSEFAQTDKPLDDRRLAALLAEDAEPEWDTSGAVTKAYGKGGIEYEINTGYNAEYLFRGRALTEEQKPIDLADLSQEIPAAQEPFSTFSLNISDASFQLALAAVEKGERPDPASIKPEQFYNAVDYGDPAPSSLEPVAAAIDQTAHPVIPGRNLVRVAIRTASTGRSAAQPLRLTLLVDQSGSMARADRRAAMDTALSQLATLLTENDRITVIGFSRTPRLIADTLPGNEAAKISDLVNTTASEGGTNLEQALGLSSELALRHKLDGAQNRIVLFTDGAANLGDADPERLAERVKELRQQRLAFDIAGIGTNDTNDRLLSELARHGNGRYYLVGENAGANLAAQLAGAFRPAAENVKVQVKLNPERVGSYKLIGFEKDRLKTEDFRDDSVDAAELAADEAGVAIYQVETLPEGSGEIGEVSVRFRDTASGEMVERAWTIPHNPATPAFDKADPKTQLATLALLAAQKLQGGPLADAIRFADHADTIARLKQSYANDAKAQRLLTLINALR